MVFQLLVLVASVACASAGLIGAPGPLAYGGHYSSAPLVSSSYSSIAAPVHAAPALYAGPSAYGYAAPSYGYAAPSAYGSVGTSHQSTLRSLDGNSAVSHHSKAVVSPFSSVSKTDTRITNDAQYAVAAPLSYGPALHAAPLSYGPALRAAAPLAYSSPLAYGASPLAYGASPLAYGHSPLVKTSATAVSGGLLGVAYSAAPAVAHMSYSNGLGVNYAW